MTPANLKVTWIALAFALAACETPVIYEPASEATSGAQAPAERPSFSPDDEFWFNIGGSSILVEVYQGMTDGQHVFRRPLQNETLYYTADMALVRIERAFGEDEYFEPDNGALAFPLTPGKTWSRTYRERTENTVFTTRRRRDCEVLDVGRFESEAGQFLAYRIACSQSRLGEAGLNQDEVIYAPAVGRIVHRRRLGRGSELTLIEQVRAQ